jgi:hypothetical protein
MSRPARKPDEKLSDERLGEPSADIRERVEAAREQIRGTGDIGYEEFWQELEPEK